MSWLSSIVGGFTGSSQNKAIQQGQDAQTAGTQAALEESRRQYDLARSDQQPWLNTGKGALDILGRQFGISPDGSVATGAQPNYSAFTASPDYQFRQDEQMRALTARNSALGIQDSGAAQRSALQLSGNLASGEYGNWYNRLAGLAGVGQTSAQATANLGQNYATQFSNLTTQNANNLASSYKSRADARDAGGQNILALGTKLAQMFL